LGVDDADRSFNGIGSFEVKDGPDFGAGARTDWLRLNGIGSFGVKDSPDFRASARTDRPQLSERERERERRPGVEVDRSSSNVGFRH